jgi:hypothetical protein
VRQLFDHRLQVGRQDSAQAEAHLEPDHAILHAQRLYSGQERQAEQRRRHDSLPREVQRRFSPQVANDDDNVDEQNRHDEIVKARQDSSVLLVALYTFGHRAPPDALAVARTSEAL